ncbi:DUF1631 domain-containing protein [Pseudomonas sp. 6D_7.1_Bac1]|uniref:DUF1631 domain-containing protein n=1 Tax=Pseudomonas sp. 6D_7.1_Bac1 TaxID=2971615 RepID=UPI0021C8E041|nr:DUF1631 domain-containing protein [Pseudomonas sp. 6D_7.1_Bac1]MCU1748515.1 DUF1631 domain-containing protein [Pseudomonas sp. 6D_7.1_Bac1]
MHNDGNVVPLHKAATDQASPSPLARLPVILLQVRDKAAQQLRHGLQALFDNADDTLFEMADRAQNNIDQNTFFEAMRDLRLKRKSIERGFLESYFEAFVGLIQYDQAHATAPLAMSFDPSTDLPHDDLERQVALEGMVTKALKRDGLALGQLTARLSALLGKPLDDSHNPIGPAMLCEYFLQAGRNLGVEIKVKLIILKLFERYVLSDADQLYAQANQLLIATGVLPELKAAPARRSTDRATARVHAESAESGARSSSMQIDESVQEVFAALQALLYPVRGSVAPTLEASAQTQPISTRDLLRLLSHLQQYVPAPAAQDDFDLRNQLEQLLTRVSVKSGKSRVVGVADEDVINLIAMLFEFILDDHNLPDSLKALIGRLQIPMLKVAVLDKSFFSRSSHPARRLLNEIAAAAMGWGQCDDHQRDSLYLRIEQVVQRLLNDFVDDPVIFSELLSDFLVFTEEPSMVEVVQEIVLRTADEGPIETASARLAEDDAALRQVDQLRQGNWVEFQEDDENTLRYKLAAIIQPTGKYIFVNRTGLKVLERSRTGLALEFRRGAVRTLDDTLLFDRALESVIGNLRRLNRGK